MKFLYNRRIFIVLGIILFIQLGISITSLGQTILVDPTGDGGFENGTTFSANGWTVVNDDTNYWTVGTTTYNSGSRSAYVSTNGTNNSYDIPTDNTSHFYRDITVPAGEDNITLSFYLKGTGEKDYDRLLIYTAPTTVTPVAGEPEQWTTDISGATLVYTQPDTMLSYTFVTVTLDASLAGTTFRLIFTWQNDNNTGVQPPAAIDDISVTSCPGVDFSTTTTTIATGTSVSFTDNSSGNPTSWLWSFSGGTPSSSSSQNPTITYNTAGTYDVSLTATAGGCSNTETKTNYITVQDYCTPSAANEHEYISRVQINNDIDNSTGLTTGGYADYTNLSTNVLQGASNISLDIDVGDRYDSSNDISVWVDWNKDGDFNDSGEDIVCDDSADDSNSYSFDVPSNALVGNTRMRIRLKWNGSSCQTNGACGSTSYGESEDYTINICKNPDIPTLSFSANPVCSGDDVTLIITGDLNSATQWAIYTGSCGGTLVGTTTTSTYTLTNVTSSETYYVRGESDCITGGNCNNVTLTVDPDNTITLSSAAGTNNQSVCLNSAITDITYTTTGATGATFSGLPSGVTGSWAANEVTISGSPSASGTFNYTVTLTGGCGNVTANGTITVDPTSVGGTAAADQTICSGTNPTDITLTGETGTIQWQVSTDNVTFSNIAGATATPLTSAQMGALTAIRYYRAAVTSGSCSVAYSDTVTIDVYETTITGGTVGGSAVLNSCEGVNPNASSVSGISGGDGNYTYQWEESTDCTGTWINATAQDGVTNTTSFNPPTLYDTICYRLETTDGCGNVGYSTTKTYNVAPDPVSQDIDETPASGTILCIGDNASATFSGGSGGTGTITDVYEYSTDNAANWNSYTSGSNITATTAMIGTDMIQIRTQRTASGSGCNNGSWNYVEWTVDPDNTIALSSAAGTDNQSVCLNSAITDITYTTTGATGATFSGLPSGVTGSWASNTATISGSPSAFGTFNYTVTLTGGCGNVTANGTITVEDLVNPTIACPANITTNPDDADNGVCTASGVALGTPTTSDNCHVASVTNNASEPYSMGNTTVVWTVTDDAGNTATCNQTVTVQPTNVIDIRVEDLGNSCQSGETGTQTQLTWDITLVAGTNSWTYDYTINDGTSNVATGTNVSATGNIQISYTMDNSTATDITYTLTLTNVNDNCGVSETNTTNNSDAATMYGVPNTSDITTN